jgi:predicted secreted acid phosphatase
MRLLSRVLIALTLAYSVSIASSDGVSPRDGDTQVPANLGKLKLELKDYHSRDYDSQVAAKLQEAGDWIRKRAPEVKKPALVLDIDETSLSNWEELVANDFAFVAAGPCAAPAQMPCGSTSFDQLTRATAILPTLKVYQEAKALGVAIFFITGRFDDPLDKSSTELNLWKVGYEGWSGLYLRPDHAGTVAAYKTGIRKKIAKDYTIIANIGDQDSDLDGGFAERTFKVPNPFYFIP